MVQDLNAMIFYFFNLKGKYLDDYNVSMQHLVDNYSFSKIDYKLFYPNLIWNDEHIELHQKNHCDFTINAPIVLISKKRKSKKITKKWWETQKVNHNQ